MINYQNIGNLGIKKILVEFKLQILFYLVSMIIVINNQQELFEINN